MKSQTASTALDAWQVEALAALRVALAALVLLVDCVAGTRPPLHASASTPSSNGGGRSLPSGADFEPELFVRVGWAFL